MNVHGVPALWGKSSCRLEGRHECLKSSPPLALVSSRDSSRSDPRTDRLRGDQSAAASRPGEVRALRTSRRFLKAVSRRDGEGKRRVRSLRRAPQECCGAVQRTCHNPQPSLTRMPRADASDVARVYSHCTQKTELHIDSAYRTRPRVRLRRLFGIQDHLGAAEERERPACFTMRDHSVPNLRRLPEMHGSRQAIDRAVDRGAEMI